MNQILFVVLFVFASASVQAQSVYQAINPKDGKVAKEICEEANGEFLGSQALIKSEDGVLHSEGPNQQQVDESFTHLSELLTQANSTMAAKYHQASNWEWLEIRFLCYQSEKEALSFVLRARSTGGALRSYELTYLYSGTEVQQDSNGFDLSNVEISPAIADGYSVNGGIFDQAIDDKFIVSVLSVAFGDEFVVAIPLD